MSKDLSKMRPSTVYVVVALIFTSFVLIYCIKYSGWGMQMYSEMTDNQLAPAASNGIDLDEFIALQPHYKKLCELDRYKETIIGIYIWLQFQKRENKED